MESRYENLTEREKGIALLAMYLLLRKTVEFPSPCGEGDESGLKRLYSEAERAAFESAAGSLWETGITIVAPVIEAKMNEEGILDAWMGRESERPSA